MEQETSEERLVEYKSKMGDDLGFIFHSLEETHIWNKKVFCQFKELYSVYQTRVDLMNECAPDFFHMLSFVFYDSIILGIGKLFDPKVTIINRISHENISFFSLNEYVCNEVQIYILEQLKKIELQLSNIKTKRNKEIGHFDRYTHESKNFAPVNIKIIKEIHEVAESILNKVSMIYLEKALRYESIESDKSYLSILRHLQKSLRYKKHIMSLWEDGKEAEMDPDDVINRKYKIE